MALKLTGWWDVAQVGTLSIANTPFDKYDYMICHSLQHDADGNVDPSLAGRDVEAVADDFVAAANAANCIPLLGLLQTPTGSSTYTVNNTTPATIDNFISSYVNYAQSKGFQGIVTDWESNITDAQWVDVHAKFRAAWPGMYLVPYFAINNRDIASQVDAYVDEHMINTYDSYTADFNGDPLTVAWHNAATNGDAPYNNVKSAEGMVAYSQAIPGFDVLPLSKVTLAVPFYARELNDPSVPTVPGAAITSISNWNSPTYSLQEIQNLPHWATRAWDSTVNAPYIPDDGTNGFVTYSDAQHMLYFAALADEYDLRGLASFAVHQDYLPLEVGDAQFPMSTQLEASAAYAPPGLLRDFLGYPYTKTLPANLLTNGENPEDVAPWSDWFSELTSRSGILYDFGNPDGSTQLNHLGADGTANWKYIRQAWTGTANQQFMVSAYFHAGEETWAAIHVGDTNVAVWRNAVWFNLTGDGALGDTPLNTAGNPVVSTSIEAVGPLDATGFRWFRCSVLVDPPTDLTAFSVSLALAAADNGQGYTATAVGDGIYIWGVFVSEDTTITWPAEKTALAGSRNGIILDIAGNLVNEVPSLIVPAPV
tara:strand:+ start:1195 stop:2976 length:1782 start_codon:yes stop_codon:yes gene_type:complete